MKLDLSIVVVTYRCAPELNECLNSLKGAGLLDDRSTETLIVDNNSGDGTAEVAEQFAPSCTVLRRNENDGFAAACNAATEIVRGRRVLFLNPDSIVSPDSIRELTEYLEANPRVAAVGPQIVNREGKPQPCARAFPTLGGEFARLWSRVALPLGFKHDRLASEGVAGPVDWISGACFLVNRDAWNDFGPFDTGFFLYFEETDWCRRAWDAGWEIHHHPSARVCHIGGCSAQRSGEVVRDGQVASHYRDSRRRYFRKHYGLLTAFLVEGLHASRQVFNGITVGANS